MADRLLRELMPLTRASEQAVGATLNATVFGRIRADIIACRLLPDQRLPLDALRERYGAGGSPIREALMRLAAEGLVELEQNKGFRVSAISAEQLVDLMRMRSEIESLALRWSIEKGDVEWEAELLGAFHRLSRQRKVDVPGKGNINPSWSKEHRTFHTALAAACGSPTLLEMRDGLFDRTVRCVALSILSRAAPRNDAAEHEQIMRAALSRDSVRAVALIREHIERTAEKVLESLTDQPRSSRVSVAKAGK